MEAKKISLRRKITSEEWLWLSLLVASKEKHTWSTANPDTELNMLKKQNFS